MKRVKEILRAKGNEIYSIPPDTSVYDAIHLLAEKEIGALLVMDGPERGGEEISAADAYSHARDQWATAEYRQEMAQVLVKRCLSRLDT